jgi:hypothetical protein
MIRHNIFLLVILLFFGCNQSTNRTNKISPSKSNFDDSLIIPKSISTFSRESENLYWIPKDTITVHNNFLKYLVTNDSCCLNNIYINWGNDSVNRIEIAQSVRQFRSYFTPSLVHETEDYLILEHGCSTECKAVLFLPLNNYEKIHHILNIVKYNPKSYIVICGLLDNTNLSNHEFLVAINIKTGNQKRIIFKNTAIAANPILLIDSCNISDDEIYLRANLNVNGKNNVIEELRLTNDINK